jgi:hypothetical protein
VVRVRAVHLDLPESSHLISKLPELHVWQQPAKRMVALYLALECHFGAGKKAHCHLASDEALTSAAAKARLVAAGGDDTIRTRVFDVVRNLDWPALYTGRALQNAFSRRWHGRDRTASGVDVPRQDLICLQC